MFSKNGGRLTYVEVLVPLKSSPDGASSAFHRSSPCSDSSYAFRNISARTDELIASETSFCDGQTSRRKTGFAALIVTERLGCQIDVHRACERVGNDKRRRREIVGAHQWIDSSFKISIAAENRGHNKTVILHRRGNGFGKRAAVADAGRAAIADQVEAQPLQVRHQSGIFQIIRYDA